MSVKLNLSSCDIFDNPPMYVFDLWPLLQTPHHEVTGGQTDEGLGPEIVSPNQSLLCKESPLKAHSGKPSKGEFLNCRLSH